MKSVNKIKIGDFCKTGSGGTPSRSNTAFFQNGTVPWVKSGELKNRFVTEVEEYITEEAIKKSSAKIVPKNSLLLAMYGATVGEVSQLIFDATTNQAICNILPDSKICDVNYLYRYLQFSKPLLLNRRVGGGQPNISQGVIKDLEVPLPPLPEQKRIAQILDKADELRQKRQQSIEKLDELLQATFIDMFGDPITNPKGWEICEVGKVTDCIVPARDKPKSFTGDIPWITTDDLNHLGFTETSKKNIGLTNEEITLAKARLIPKNSVVISCVGNLGLASIASDNFVMNQQLHSFQCGDKILPEFLIFCLPFQKGYMLSRATSTTVPYMNKSVCNSIPVTVPPLDLQKKWKLIFENSNKQKQVLKKQLAQQENLFQSLQQRAFNGEL